MEFYDIVNFIFASIALLLAALPLLPIAVYALLALISRKKDEKSKQIASYALVASYGAAALYYGWEFVSNAITCIIGLFYGFSFTNVVSNIFTNATLLSCILCFAFLLAAVVCLPIKKLNCLRSLRFTLVAAPVLGCIATVLDLLYWVEDVLLYMFEEFFWEYIIQEEWLTAIYYTMQLPLLLIFLVATLALLIFGFLKLRKNKKQPAPAVVE